MPSMQKQIGHELALANAQGKPSEQSPETRTPYNAQANQTRRGKHKQANAKLEGQTMSKHIKTKIDQDKP